MRDRGRCKSLAVFVLKPALSPIPMGRTHRDWYGGYCWRAAHGDLIAVKGDPLADISPLVKLAIVVRGGEIVKRAGS